MRYDLFGERMGKAMMTQDEAKAEIEAELRARKLAKKITKPMTAGNDLLDFCIEIHNRLKFKCAGNPVSRIRGWVEEWQKRQIWSD
jgi:hypothetical protein